jgi:hypothetical protein
MGDAVSMLHSLEKIAEVAESRSMEPAEAVSDLSRIVCGEFVKKDTIEYSKAYDQIIARAERKS